MPSHSFCICVFSFVFFSLSIFFCLLQISSFKQRRRRNQYFEYRSPPHIFFYPPPPYDTQIFMVPLMHCFCLYYCPFTFILPFNLNFPFFLSAFFRFALNLPFPVSRFQSHIFPQNDVVQYPPSPNIYTPVLIRNLRVGAYLTGTIIGYPLTLTFTFSFPFFFSLSIPLIPHHLHFFFPFCQIFPSSWPWDMVHKLWYLSGVRSDIF